MSNGRILIFVSDTTLISVSEMHYVENNWNLYDKVLIFALKENEIDLDYKVFTQLWIYYFNRIGFDTTKLKFCLGEGICFNTPKTEYLNGLIQSAHKLGYDNSRIHISVPLGEDIVDLADKIDYQKDILDSKGIDYDIRKIDPDFAFVSKCFKSNSGTNLNLCKSYLFPEQGQIKNNGQIFGTSGKEFENKIMNIFNEVLKTRDVYIFITEHCIPDKNTMKKVREVLMNRTNNDNRSKYIYLSICSNEKPDSKLFNNVKILWQSYFDILSKQIGYEIKSFYYILLPSMNKTWDNIIKTIDNDTQLTIIYTKETSNYIDYINTKAEQQTRYIEPVEIEAKDMTNCFMHNCQNPFPNEFNDIQKKKFEILFSRFRVNLNL